MNSELMMFYNVENFFPPNLDNTELPTSGLRNWDDYKYNLKIRKITQVFRFIEEDYGQLPSVIGLAEIGARSVLENLTDENSPINNYEIIYQPSKDLRGLSVALLFDKSKYSLLKFRTLQFQMDEDVEFETRDILHAELFFEENKLHIFVCHLPSKRNRDEKKGHRDYILEQLRETIQSLSDKGESVVLMGDFNDNPDSEGLQKLLLNRNNQKMLINPFEELYQTNQFTTYHGKKGVLFDQILYTEDFLSAQLKSQTITAEIYSNPKIRNKDRKNNHFPIRTYSGSRYMGGFSDHFPVVLKVVKY